MVHFLEKAIRDYLSVIRKPDVVLLKECLANIKTSIIDIFHVEPEAEFRIRMSNLGRDTRQLMLQRKYGRAKAEPEFLLKMLTGHIQEHVLVYILKSAGIKLQQGGKTKIVVDERTIEGTWDLKIEVDGKIYDVKTASEYSYKNKFIDYRTLQEDDPFGYIDQLIAYCEGEGVEPGGWIVLNKSSGEFKVIEYPVKMEDVRESFLKRVSNKIKQVFSDTMPSCTGIVNETYYQKPTGNRVLGGNCRWCDHWQKCHPTATLEPSRASKAKDKPMVRYVN